MAPGYVWPSAVCLVSISSPLILLSGLTPAMLMVIIPYAFFVQVAAHVIFLCVLLFHIPNVPFENELPTQVAHGTNVNLGVLFSKNIHAE
jgi:hypothetical protein